MNSTVITHQTRSIPATLVTSSVGKKYLAAITGFVSFAYILGHMAGNLQIFLGQDQLNGYAEFLHSLGAGLWIIRIILGGAFAIHIWMGIQTKLQNWSARPRGYVKGDTVQASLASRTMIWTGIIVFAFFVFHILQFTARVVDPSYQQLFDEAGRPDVYSMVILGFSNTFVSLFYIFAVGLACYHLTHGFKSMWQSMGWNKTGSERTLKVLAWILSIVIFLGFTAVPFAVLTGIVKLPMEGI
jgi:succinate dehydrogenase / fumarate reductase cytochrome b subunit